MKKQHETKALDGLDRHSTAGHGVEGHLQEIVRCEPTTHRFVRRAFHPTPHHPLECRPEPTPSTPARGGSGLHCRSGASRASSTGGRWSGSAARVLPPICEVSRVVTGTDAGNGGTGANERPSVANSNCLCHQSKRCAVGRRRQKRSDALSEKTKRCAVVRSQGRYRERASVLAWRHPFLAGVFGESTPFYQKSAETTTLFVERST